ncbi:MAG: hypothetical protein Q4E13_05560 [Clostridia bacterium]|nr:hypothetical protein [Clostridia bacterium]
MSSIRSLSGVPDSVLEQQHTTTDGRVYDINYSDKLTQSTAYIGKDKSNANSQGWERDSNKFFKELKDNHPEMFSLYNARRIERGEAPVVDRKMINHNPHLADYKGETLIHHHIGGDGEATAVPQSVHTGYGGVHNHERNAGIREECKKFSDRCEEAAKKDSSLYGQKVDEFHKRFDVQSDQTKQNTQSKQSDQTKPSAQSRADLVSSKSTNTAKGTNRSRAALVTSENGMKSAKSSANEAQSRANAVSSGGNTSSGSQSGKSSGQSGGSRSSSGGGKSGGSGGQSGGSSGGSGGGGSGGKGRSQGR